MKDNMPEALYAQTPLWLGVDTCGVIGSVALGRWVDERLEVVGEREMEGRSCSSTLVIAVADLLARTGVDRPQGIVAVSGPGSFTGVRIGLSAVKGLADAWAIPVVEVTRLEVQAARAEILSAALDAHRHEVFLRLAEDSREVVEQLAGDEELTQLAAEWNSRPGAAPVRIAVSDQAAAALLVQRWPQAELVWTAAPTAADALRFARTRIVRGEFADVALLDGHYLRRSDAEIFGEKPEARPAEAFSSGKS